MDVWTSRVPSESAASALSASSASASVTPALPDTSPTVTRWPCNSTAVSTFSRTSDGSFVLSSCFSFSRVLATRSKGFPLRKTGRSRSDFGAHRRRWPRQREPRGKRSPFVLPIRMPEQHATYSDMDANDHQCTSNVMSRHLSHHIRTLPSCFTFDLTPSRSVPSQQSCLGPFAPATSDRRPWGGQ